jgi:hypothetical protein
MTLLICKIFLPYLVNQNDTKDKVDPVLKAVHQLTYGEEASNSSFFTYRGKTLDMLLQLPSHVLLKT